MKPTAFFFTLTVLVFLVWIAVKIGILALLIAFVALTVVSFIVEVALQVSRNLKDDQDGK